MGTGDLSLTVYGLQSNGLVLTPTLKGQWNKDENPLTHYLPVNKQFLNSTLWAFKIGTTALSRGANRQLAALSCSPVFTGFARQARPRVSPVVVDSPVNHHAFTHSLINHYRLRVPVNGLWTCNRGAHRLPSLTPLAKEALLFYYSSRIHPSRITPSAKELLYYGY